MKIFSSTQIREIDNYTISNLPISSIDLMEKAAYSLLDKLFVDFNVTLNSFTIVCGPGNNGGDGLALARLLLKLKVEVQCYFCDFGQNISPECKTNLRLLEEVFPNALNIINNIEKFKLQKDTVIIDCLFGTGLKKPITGEFAEICNFINSSKCKVVSIDIPSGLYGEDNSQNHGAIVQADFTYSIEFPPLSCMFSENYKYFGQVKIVKIGLLKEIVERTHTDYSIINIEEIKTYLHPRSMFDHKGSFGHALIIAGSAEMAGAAVLATKACVRSGAGLTTVHVPLKLSDILQVSIPEAMLSIDSSNECFTSVSNLDKYNSIAVGPGIGKNPESIPAIIKLLKTCNSNILIDADALNLLSEIEGFHTLIKPGTILTPHPKEFERLFGHFEDSYSRMSFMSNFSKDTGIIIVLKGGVTSISLPDGSVKFNIFGNPGMATGGSGDVLTGMICSLLAQGLSPEKAAISGVYLHSKAGDFAKKKFGEMSLIASDIIDAIPESTKKIFEDYD
jgi:ADP-dependent NAD(P)H-hydrate dehydratase / NAD(P)H-hydrate epimerase